MVEIELASLDVRYESHRLRDRAGESRLLAAIAERGIAEPLEGVDAGGRHVLLNGFKRWRCARQLGLTSAPYVSLGEDEAVGIVALLRASNDRSLSLLEQAGFVDELKRLHALNLAQIAEALSRSKAWVSLRLGLLDEMPTVVRQKLFAGVFPVYRRNSMTPEQKFLLVAEESDMREDDEFGGKQFFGFLLNLYRLRAQSGRLTDEVLVEGILAAFSRHFNEEAGEACYLPLMRAREIVAGALAYAEGWLSAVDDQGTVSCSPEEPYPDWDEWDEVHNPARYDG